MPSDRSTHSISFSDELMRDVESYCDTHEIKKCEFFEIAAKSLLGRENAVPERLQGAAKSPTEQKLDRLLDAFEEEGGHGGGGTPSSGNSDYNNNNEGGANAGENVDADGDEEGGGDEMVVPDVWADLADGEKDPLTWSELKEVDEYVREEDAWDEVAIHPDRIGETKTRRDPVVTAAYGVLRWRCEDADGDELMQWIVDEHEAEELPSVRDVLRRVAPEDASQHTLFERSGSRYPSYYDQLTEHLVPHPVRDRWTTNESLVAEMAVEVLDRDPDDFVDWVDESEEGRDWVSTNVSECLDSISASEMEAHGRYLPDDIGERLWEYVPVRVAVTWLDVLVDETALEDLDEFDIDEVRATRAVYRHKAKSMGGHLAVREAVADELEPVTAEEYGWE